MSQPEPSVTDLQQMWACLEDITYILTEMAAWLPHGRDRDGVEKALGALSAVQWSCARKTGGVMRPGSLSSPDANGYPAR